MSREAPATRKRGLAVIAHIRHAHTAYDELLMGGTDRLNACAFGREQIDGVLARWSRA